MPHWRTIFSQKRYRQGNAAVEFALISPVLMLLMVGIVDIGRALMMKHRLGEAVSAGAQYALVNTGMVTSSSGAALASSIATVVVNAMYTGWASASSTVVVNGGPTASLSSGVLTTGGTASNASNYYCPTGTSPATMVWTTGSQGVACADGSLPGQFVSVSASTTYVPLFSSYGLLPSGAMTEAVVVQTQ